VTRSHKFNDRDHAGLADGTAAPSEHLPRYFAKHGFEGVDPKKTKKNGGGKGNWGAAGEEVVDDPLIKLTNARRRSNSSGYSNNLAAFKTKFDVNEPEPVFEESMGADEESLADLAKMESSETGSSSSFEDDKVATQ
jgi:hypothetical protein